MQYLKGKYIGLVNQPIDGQKLYEYSFAFYFVIAFLQTTTYTFYFPGNILHELSFVPLLIILLKTILFDSNTLKKALFNLVLFMLLFITWRQSGEFILFPMGIFVLGARNINFRRLIYIYLVIGTILLSFTFFTSLIGLTKNLIFHRDLHTIRRAFGIIYPTDFAAHVLYLVLAYCYLNFKKLSWINYGCFALLALFVLKFCDARLNAVCLLIVIPVMWIGQKARQGYINSKRIAIFYWTLPILASYLTVLASYLYKPKSVFMGLNNLLSGRLYYSHLALHKYGVKLFGQHIKENGFGAVGGLENKKVNMYNYFYVDSTFIRLLVIYGAIMLLLVVLTMTIISWQSIKYQDFALASVVVILTISAIVEQRILDLGYNPFLIALFAQCYLHQKNIIGDHHEKIYS